MLDSENDIVSPEIALPFGSVNFAPNQYPLIPSATAIERILLSVSSSFACLLSETKDTTVDSCLPLTVAVISCGPATIDLIAARTRPFSSVLPDGMISALAATSNDNSIPGTAEPKASFTVISISFSDSPSATALSVTISIRMILALESSTLKLLETTLFAPFTET